MNQLTTAPQTSGNLWFDGTNGQVHYALVETPVRSESQKQAAVSEQYRDRFRQVAVGREAEMTTIRREYLLSDTNSVTAFLQDHREIPPLLLEALPHLKKTFGEDVVFSLRTRTDEAGWRDLYVAALWAGEAQDALNFLDKFEDEWWIANSRSAAGRLNFTYELK